jgi:hypothetical protein
MWILIRHGSKAFQELFHIFMLQIIAVRIRCHILATQSNLTFRETLLSFNCFSWPQNFSCITISASVSMVNKLHVAFNQGRREHKRYPRRRENLPPTPIWEQLSQNVFTTNNMKFPSIATNPTMDIVILKTRVTGRVSYRLEITDS